MPYSVKLLKHSAQSLSKWSGGDTTQIAIFPEQAEYAKRDFLWRISTATVDTAESEFTSLPGVRRVLMVTDGEVRLTHKDHHSITLRPFEQDRFLGDWETKSYGKVRDFNLMLSGSCKGELSSYSLGTEPLLVPGLPQEEERHAAMLLYSLDGKVKAVLDGTVYDLQPGDALLLLGESTAADVTVTWQNANDLKQHEAHVICAEMYW